jgi:hypothetical protein
MAGNVTNSFLRAISRQADIPMMATPLPPRSWKRKLDSGMRSSAYHPWSSRCTAASQNVFQLKFPPLAPSFGQTTSVRIPAGVVPNASAVSLSLNVSSWRTHQSFERLAPSRRSVGAWIPDGSES